MEIKKKEGDFMGPPAKPSGAGSVGKRRSKESGWSFREKRKRNRADFATPRGRAKEMEVTT
ncbi:hypothetical protein [Christensenella tenuis]|jgi:hypothetical protein|uniref:Uncharacterized protein n=1 Tax=Christensenella tenuis TaxID=2763033 RepID=A0ABR7EER5_9FIRM|nr:hypothetical protein [Christensenella tenuis]MBC5648266.1 hypothetical protein [Christensenella tenuis]